MADKDLRARQSVLEMNRVDLEDKHLGLLEENFILKKHARSQEEKMKKMATKLLRLTADEKKEAKKAVHPLTASQLRQRDIETEDLLGELQQRVRQLEKQNGSLTSKNVFFRQQLDAYGKKRTPYDHIQGKISSGMKKKTPPVPFVASPALAIPAQNPRAVPGSSFRAVQGAIPEKVSVGVQFSGTCHSLLQGVRQDNQELEDHLLQLKAELLDKEAVINSMKEKLRLKSMQLEEEKLMTRQEWQTRIAALEREKTDQEMELIRLQRELRDSSNRLQMMRTKCNATENNLEVMKGAHSKLLDEMEGLNADLKRERDKRSRLELKTSGHDTDRHTISNLEVLVEDLRREKDHLRDASRDSTSKDELLAMKYKTRVTTLQEQVKIQEEATKRNNTERSRTLKELETERDLSSGLDVDLRKLRETYNKLKKEYDQVKEKLKFYEKESSLDWSEVEEALVLVREGKIRDPNPTAERTKAYEKELEDLRVWHADTVNELEKTRKLLQMQHTISKDYKAEVDSLKKQLEELRQQHEGRLQEYVQLMDIKAARVKKLEGQLKEIAYGTKSYRVDTSKFEYGGREEEEGERVELERGQNLLEFNISQVTLSPEALSCLATSTPALFITCSFLDYETHVTPVLQGPRPNFSYTASFVVGVDDTFLQHLQKSCIHLEVNQATGFQFHLLSVASVKCWELLSSSGGKIHGKALLTGVETMQECVSVGSVEYWMRLKLPITQATKLYRDRSKAIAAMDSMKATPTATPTSVPPSHGPDYNELTITVMKCQGLPTKDTVHFPSAYVMYKLYSFPDHDTPIISNSCTPHFMDQSSSPLSMDVHLDHYLKTQVLELYVFDEDDPDEIDPGYLGVAQVPLYPLSQSKPISGTFQLKKPSGESGGFIEVSLRWKLPYNIQNKSTLTTALPAKSSTVPTSRKFKRSPSPPQKTPPRSPPPSRSPPTPRSSPLPSRSPPPSKNNKSTLISGLPAKSPPSRKSTRSPSPTRSSPPPSRSPPP